jgi:uncharacterized protein (TIGR00297 family)
LTQSKHALLYLLSISLAAVVAYVAYRARSLTRSGAIAAFAVGAITFAISGWSGAAVLFAFFIPSTVLSRIGHTRKRALVDIGKHGARDAWQVLANGGVATACILIAPRGGAMFLAGFAGAFAAAAADTWGTEIGTLAQGKPHSILTLRPLETGFSGGITIVGTASTLAGAAFVAGVAAVTHVAPFMPVLIAGFAGATVDSILGATAQALRYCPACKRECETDPHCCGVPSELRRGIGFLENDGVNSAATLCGALVAMLIGALALPR